MYKVAESYRFIVDGMSASVHDLRKGMTVSAQRIVEEPRTEIASNTTVTGEAPPPPKVVAEAPAPRTHTPAATSTSGTGRGTSRGTSCGTSGRDGLRRNCPRPASEVSADRASLDCYR